MKPRRRDGFGTGVVFAAVLLSGCGSALRREINQRWPPVSTDEYRDRAVAAASAALGALARVDAAAHVARATLSQHLEPALKAQVPSVQAIKLSTDEQQLVAEVQFDHEFPAERVRVKGEATVHLAAATEGQQLVLQPSFSRLRVSSIAFRDGGSKIAASALTTLLEAFLNNLNGAISAQHIDLKFGVLQDIQPRDLLAELPNLSDVQGNPLRMEISLEQAAVLIDSAGVHAAAKLSQGGALVAARKMAQPLAAGAPSFDDLAKRFRNRLSHDLGELPAEHWRSTGIAVSKRYLSGQLNHGLENPGLCATFGPPGARQEFNQLLQLDPAPDLKCEERAQQHSCSINTDCSPTRDCNPHWNCPDCEWYDAPCHVRKAGCETDKVRYRTQCEAEKTAQKAACEAEKEGKRIACEIDKAARKAGCIANQAWLTAWSGANVGRIQGSAAIDGISARLCLVTAALSDDLSSLSVSTTIQASAQVKADFVYTPLDAGHVACVAQWGGSLQAAVGIPATSMLLSATIDETSDEQGAGLELRSASQELTLRTVPPPLAALLRDNPHALVVCAPAAALGLTGVTVSPKFREDLLRSDFPIFLPEQRFRFPLAPVNIVVAGQPLKLEPIWSPQALGFVIKD